MNIGFIGLGIMGKPMAMNLVKSGFHVTAFDLDKNAVHELVERGATAAESPENIATLSDVIITILPNAAIVKEVLTGEHGILAGAREGTIVVDMSSVSPIDSIDFMKACTEKGVAFLDAPVSGGQPKAIDGTLSIMAGGEEQVFEQVLPVFKAMGEDVICVGPVGSGSTTKLANQILVNVTIAAMSEAVTLAAKAGVDIQKMYEAIRGGLAGSAVLDAKIPLVLERDFAAGGRIDINLKDLTNVLSSGRDLGVPMPLTSNVLEMFHALKADGKSDLDHSALVQYYEKLANFQVTKGAQ